MVGHVSEVEPEQTPLTVTFPALCSPALSLWQRDQLGTLNGASTPLALALRPLYSVLCTVGDLHPSLLVSLPRTLCPELLKCLCWLLSAGLGVEHVDPTASASTKAPLSTINRPQPTPNASALPYGTWASVWSPLPTALPVLPVSDPPFTPRLFC